MAKYLILHLSPLKILILYISIGLLIYIDRGVLSSAVPVLKSHSQGGLGLNSFLAGTLGSAFLLGYMITAPIFAHLAQFYHPEYLMCVGLGIWCGSVVMTGLSTDYAMIVVARSLTGIGEASFICLAPPVIIDIAPEGRKNLWIGLFFIGNVLGNAFGFVFGEVMTNLFGAWYYAFFIESLIMLPLLLASLFNYKDPKFYAKASTETGLTILKQVQILFENPVFTNLTLGYAAYSFTISSVSFWGPAFIEEHFNESSSTATLSLGGVTIFVGVIGTYCGSLLLDYAMGSHKKNEMTISESEFIRTRVCCNICWIAGTVGVSFGVAGCVINNFYSFLIGLALAEFFVFMTISPFGIAIMTCITPNLRGQSNAISLFFSYALGGFPAPTATGGFFEAVGQRWGMTISIGWLIFAAGFWLCAWVFSKHSSGPFTYRWIFWKRQKRGDTSLNEDPLKRSDLFSESPLVWQEPLIK